MPAVERQAQNPSVEMRRGAPNARRLFLGVTPPSTIGAQSSNCSRFEKESLDYLLIDYGDAAALRRNIGFGKSEQTQVRR
jgi:hypothetical protein